MVMIQVNFFHLAVVFPFLIYIALNPDKSNVKKAYPIVQIMAVSLFLYHGYLSYEKSRGDSEDYSINVVHMMLVAPLLYYISTNKFRNKELKNVVLGISGVGIVYHSFQVFKKKNLLPNEKIERMDGITENEMGPLIKDTENVGCQKQPGSFN